MSGVWRIDPTAGKIYWTNWNLGTIRVGSLSGAAPAQSLYTGQTDPWMVALLRAPLGTAAPQVSGNPGVGQTLTCSPASWAADLLSGFLYRAPQSIAYQWSVDGAPIAGATSTSVVVSAPGAYRCAEIATNAAGSTTQTSAPTTVSAPKLPPPRLGRLVNAAPVTGKVFAGRQRPAGAADRRGADPHRCCARRTSRDGFADQRDRSRVKDANRNLRRCGVQGDAGKEW